MKYSNKLNKMEKMKNKTKLLLAIVFSVFVLTVLPAISALTIGVTLYAPVNYTNHTDTVTYNCTTPAFSQVENVSIYANSSTGTMTLLGSKITNSSVNQSAWEGSVAITSANDGTGYIISCFAENSSVDVYSAEIASTGIMLDSTAPICNISFLHPTIAYAGLQKIDFYSSDVIERVSTSTTVDGPGKQTTITLTDQNGPIELASNDTKYTGTWTVSTTVTDRAGNTCTDSKTFKSYLPDKDGVPITPPVDKGRTLLLLLIVGVIAYFIFKKK